MKFEKYTLFELRALAVVLVRLTVAIAINQFTREGSSSLPKDVSKL
ncbi:hypothetical protein HUN01_02025 (plasmid) [Nostoc edaphicum CCNP1411]|uniref:Uncharacterized protein n=1 Tax=Nostoc edaphicum CCNP1411 TaxID=1472755 RepID=A0A7D7L9T1_9NOSO|nr:hypothetical protein [Nostoc edaphicum]QMS86410.1 hypothetical protein HUN01_02025 [Nostoc edaphicum CCNP1411]